MHFFNYSSVIGVDGQINSLTTVRPTPVIPGLSSSVIPGSSTTPGVDGEWSAGKDVVLPRDEFLVRTVLESNMTLLHNRIEDFKTAMEANLTSLYRNAYYRR